MRFYILFPAIAQMLAVKWQAILILTGEILRFPLAVGFYCLLPQLQIFFVFKKFIHLVVYKCYGTKDRVNTGNQTTMTPATEMVELFL
ncbi:hypothetical protein RIF29_36103 [Crotalaria pallida]|uniref:Uncharacterized protein n=1 Tax=Crotalaria pallida TaxID=3830 RepID=A0AAN9EH43_CROPI